MSEFWTLMFRFSFGLLCHSVILNLMINRKYSRGLTLGVWLGAFVLTSLTMFPLIRFTQNTNILFVVEAFTSMAVYCGVYLILSKGSVWKNLFIIFTYATFFLFALTLSSCISQMFFNGSHWATVAGRTLFLGMYTVWLIWKRATQPFPPALAGYMDDKEWASLAAFAVFAGLTAYITALSFLILRVDVKLRLAIAGVLFLLIGSAYLVASRTIVLLNREHETRQLEAQRKLLETQLATEREFVALANTRRHDLRHHVGILNHYLQQGDVPGAREYLGEYQAQLDADILAVYCENAAANALLSNTARRCAGGHIPFTCHAAIPRTLSLTNVELVTVLGNVLENAWEASRGSVTPWIDVSACTRHRSLLVEVKNCTSGEIPFDDDMPVSTKAGGGLGLKSVRMVVEKHGGLVHCQRSGDTFFTQVVIPL